MNPLRSDRVRRNCNIIDESARKLIGYSWALITRVREELIERPKVDDSTRHVCPEKLFSVIVANYHRQMYFLAFGFVINRE